MGEVAPPEPVALLLQEPEGRRWARLATPPFPHHSWASGCLSPQGARPKWVMPPQCLRGLAEMLVLPRQKKLAPSHVCSWLPGAWKPECRYRVPEVAGILCPNPEPGPLPHKPAALPKAACTEQRSLSPPRCGSLSPNPRHVPRGAVALREGAMHVHQGRFVSAGLTASSAARTGRRRSSGERGWECWLCLELYTSS